MDAGSQERRSGTLTRECEGVKPEGRLVETGVEDRGVWQREPELGDRDSLEGSGSCGRSCVHAAGPGPGWLGRPGVMRASLPSTPTALQVSARLPVGPAQRLHRAALLRAPATLALHPAPIPAPDPRALRHWQHDTVSFPGCPPPAPGLRGPRGGRAQTALRSAGPAGCCSGSPV